MLRNKTPVTAADQQTHTESDKVVNDLFKDRALLAKLAEQGMTAHEDDLLAKLKKASGCE